jgi:hypothetical protein
MKPMSNLARFVLASAISVASVGIEQSTDARTYSQEDGAYVQDRLPNGVLTGPIARDANGG